MFFLGGKWFCDGMAPRKAVEINFGSTELSLGGGSKFHQREAQIKRLCSPELEGGDKEV